MVAGNEFPQAMDPETGGPVLLGKATVGNDPSQGMDKQKIEHTAMAEEDMHWRKNVEAADMADVLMNWPAFGTFNMFMFCTGVHMKFVTLSILLVQVVVPVALFASQYHSYNKGWCPSTGSPGQRVLMSCIALFYFVRSIMMYLEKKNDSIGNGDDMPKSSKDLRPWHDECQKQFAKRLESGIEDSILMDYAVIDEFVMNLTYESLVLLLNLWLVFIADDALDIVLNSLAMEFVGKIDDEFKVRLFRIARLDIAKDIMTQELHKPKPHRKQFHPFIEFFFDFCGIVGMFALPVASFVMFFYGAACKP